MCLIFSPDHTTFHLFSQVITEKAAQTTIHLLMQDASATDSGVFECIPDNAPPAKVKVHILTAGNVVCSKKKLGSDHSKGLLKKQFIQSTSNLVPRQACDLFCLLFLP